MAVIFPITYGEDNNTDLISGIPLATAGLRLIDHGDFVGPEKVNRPMKNLAANDQEINYHLQEITRLAEDGVFENFGEKFQVIRTSSVSNTSMTFEVREGLGKIGNQAFRVNYQPNITTDYTVDENGDTVPVAVPADVTTISINVTAMGQNDFRRDLIVLDNTGEIVVIQGSNTTFLPAEYSQIDAPPNTIALYSILFRKVSGIMQTPTISAVYNTVKIDGVDLIENFTTLFGNGIFIGEPDTETDPTKIEFNPSILGGTQYFVSAGSAIIDGTLVQYGSAGNSITLQRSYTSIGTGSTPGATQGSNTNNWELVDFTTNSAGAAGTGNGNTQYLLFDNTGNTGLIDAGSIKIFTASPVGEGGFSVERPFDVNAVGAPTTEEYSIDVNNGLIRREKSSAPLRVYIRYSFSRNRRYLPYFDKFGTLSFLQSADTYPALPPEFSPNPNPTGLPENAIALKSMLFAATNTTLQPNNFGEDFRTYMNFQLENGQVTTNAIADGAVTGDKLTSGAIDNSDLIGDDIILERHLSNELLSSLSTSKVYKRSSLAFKVDQSDFLWTFSDNTDAVNEFLPKALTDVTGTALTLLDGETQNPAERPVAFKNVFKDSISTEVETDPSLARATFTITSDDIGGVLENGEEITLPSVALSFQDFGFSQVGDALVILYNPNTNNALATAQVPLTTIKNFVDGKINAFYKFTFSTAPTILLGGQYQIRIAKTIPTDTLFVHTGSEGAGRSTDLAFRAFYLPQAGKYGTIAGNVQGYRIFDDIGDITIPSIERATQGRPERYIPYAANITDRDTFTVFTDVDSDDSNYVAVDVTRGIFKFTEGSQPVTSRITTDHNIITGLANLSSERIHRWNGLSIEHSLRVLETELGSVRANVRNNIEKLYYLGQSDNGTGAKFRFSSQDRQLTDLAGEALRLEDANLASPIHVIDRNYIIPEGRESSRVIQDSFNGIDIIEFTPRFDNVAIFSINFTESGTDYDAVTIQLHAGEYDGSSLSQPPITTATIARSAITESFNFFRLESDLEIGETYHVLIRVVNFLGGLGVRPRLKTDVETGEIEFQQYFLPEPGLYGTEDGFAIYDEFGDLNIGSEERGSVIDSSQENFLDADGWQIQSFFDDNDIDPEDANTTFPIFTPSRPDRTGMVRFDIYIKDVPSEGEDGYNGVFRLLLHDSANNPIRPNNALPGQNYIDVRVPREPGWLQIPFKASLIFGESYHMHIWSNGFDIQMYVGTHAVTDQKAYRYIAGERFIPFAANLCDGDNFDTFEIVARKLVAIDPRCGRIKFHPDDITANNKYVANFNLFTKTSELQSDTIVTPEGNTLQDKLTDFAQIRKDAMPTRLGVGLYRFNKISNKLSDQLGRRLDREDGELPNPYERVAISDTNTGGTPSTLTTTGTDNEYRFFIDHFKPVLIESINLDYNEVEKDYYNTILRISRSGSNTVEKTALIKSTDLVVGPNEIILEDLSGEPLNFLAEPNIQYVFSYTADVSGPGTAPKLSKNNNDTITTTIKFKPQYGGLYGTEEGITIDDDDGDIFRFNFSRDDKEIASVVANTASGLVSLKNATGKNTGILVWEENQEIKAARYDLGTGDLIDASKLQIAGSSGDPAIQPSVDVYDDIAFTVWQQSGHIYGRRLFLNESDPLSIDVAAYQITDSGAANVSWPSVAAGRDRMMVVWEDDRDTPSGVINATPNSQNVFAFSFDSVTDSSGQYNPAPNAIGGVIRVNMTQNFPGVVYERPEVKIHKDNAVIVYSSDVNNIGLSNDIFLSVYNLENQDLIRTDIRVDKAPTLDVTTQVDSIMPKIANYRNKFAIAWLDDRGTPGVQYQPYGKIYDSNELTFDQSDTLIDGTLSGIINMNIHASEKILSLGISNGGDGRAKRIDFNSLTPHDVVPFDANIGDSLNNDFSYVYPSSIDNITHVYVADVSGNAIIRSRVNGLNIEPIAVDLTNQDRDIPEGYIGIDVINGIYKFAEGEEI